MTLFPVTPTAVPGSSSYTSAAVDSFTLTGSCLRHSTMMSNRNEDATTQRRKGVRLFQERSGDADIKSEGRDSNVRVLPMNRASAGIPYEEEGSIVSYTRSRKRVTRSTSTTDADSDGKTVTAQQRRSGVSPTLSTPARGSNAMPVTPEPVSVENKRGSARPSRKVAKEEVKMAKITTTKTKGKLKTTKVKRITKAKAKAKAKTTVTTKKIASRVSASWPAPKGWRETYELVRELRKDKTAPCDVMGAEALALSPPDMHDNGDVDMDDGEHAKTSRFQTLVALMLSSQTKDAMVAQAMGNLRNTSDESGGLTVASILAMDPQVLNAKIYSVGFRNNKTKYIKQVAQILHDDYNEDIPPTADEMIRKLPGIGPKMAYIIENVCWNKQTGIGVDTHMQRLFPKLGWVSPETKNPEQTRKQLESWLPHEYWGEVNLLWVGFGQEVQQEQQKVLRKAVQCDKPVEALSLLRSVGFDVVKEWSKLQSVDPSTPEGESQKKRIWTDANGREKIRQMIEEVESQK